MAGLMTLPKYPSPPDVMNDPAFETNSPGKERNKDDQDTCRICRGEGLIEEPLFHPCKCSGSIKFVHQDCLMEWLSHSNKKHCELCKTSFRFTKLYDPGMPITVPLSVFLRRAAIHTFKSLLTWSRFNLVAFVWLGWLPWSMRTVWRGLFWIGDGGWLDWQGTNQTVQSYANRIDNLRVLRAIPSTSLTSAYAVVTNAVTDPQGNSSYSRFFAISQTLDFSAGEPLVFKLSKAFIRTLLLQPMLSYYSTQNTSADNATVLNAASNLHAMKRAPSWLSRFGFLRSLTRWPLLNDILIDTMEGQLITLLVVVTFVLVFLIREWVVHQQPFALRAAEPNAQARPEAQAREVEIAGAVPDLVNQDQESRRDTRPGESEDARDQSEDTLSKEQDSLPREGTPYIYPQHRRSESFATSPTDPDQAQNSLDLGKWKSGRQRSHSDAGPSGGFGRPTLRARDASTTASEIRRTIEERSNSSGRDWPGLDVFMDLWKRADGQPSEVLRIVEAEDRQEELAWIVNAMQRLVTTAGEHSEAKSDVISRDEPMQDLPTKHASGSIRDSWQFVQGETDRDVEDTTIVSQGSRKDKTELKRRSSGDVQQDRILQSNLEPDDLGDNEPFKKDPATGNRKSKIGHHNRESASIDADSSASSRAPEVELEDSEITTHDPSGSKMFSQSGNEIDEQLVATNSGAIIPNNPSEKGPDRCARMNRSSITDPCKLSLYEDMDILFDWMWGELDSVSQGENIERAAQGAVERAALIDDDRGQLLIGMPNAERDQVRDLEAVQAAGGVDMDPHDPEAIEDAEDLEGVMELIGMQGPLAGLLQNGMFSAILVSLTVFFGVWIPYIAGKLFLVFLASPISLLVKLPLRWASAGADILIDTLVFVAGYALYWIDASVRLLWTPMIWLVPFVVNTKKSSILGLTARAYAESALDRLAEMFVATGDSLYESDIPVFSIIAHESLKAIESQLEEILSVSHAFVTSLLNSNPSQILAQASRYKVITRTILGHGDHTYTSLGASLRYRVETMGPLLLNINPLRISLDIPQRISPLDFSLAYWSTRDRIIAIMLGYLFFSTIGALYLKISSSIRDSKDGEKIDGTVADILYQAGGVLKVILIISIEMIVFPLYCGLLLDVALLPLFENASAISRVNFTLGSPATSIFVHWFIGTCYMFHFALFVSMCRKIMRSGVLYFIRDPDDPTFHPVRDVLERNVSTQLRKIAFSAMVYGALVIICLGGVVWTLSSAIDGIFPIHWSSNEPVLEFPIDLLFYNFLMPLAVKFLKPSNGLNKMYTWWFRKCARSLRLTQFLFGERKEDEEGHYTYHTWRELLISNTNAARPPTRPDQQDVVAVDGVTMTKFQRDGKYVRAPASDQVRIPKGTHTFIEVNEQGQRMDGHIDFTQDQHEQDKDMFTKVYIPPYFRLRLSVFIFLIWLFAASTGVGITIVPLVIGRKAFSCLIATHLRMNDIYAFSIGIFTLGAPSYIIIRYRGTITSFPAYVRSLNIATNGKSIPMPTRSGFFDLLRVASRFFLLLYFYITIAFLLPILLAFLTEAYFLIPLHTYLSSSSSPLGPLISERHTIHFIQSWTLGVLYLKVSIRLILWAGGDHARPARALRMVVRRGWLDPDVGLATRGFILPAVVVIGFALVIPLASASIVNKLVFGTSDSATMSVLTSALDGTITADPQLPGDEVMRSIIYRYSYPAVLAFFFAIFFIMGIVHAVGNWRRKIRDEVYLIGERLHNFGEKGAKSGIEKGKAVERAR